MKRPMSSQIAELKQIVEAERGNNRSLQSELKSYKDRISIIAAENESLRKDKSWLQSMHSAALQAFFQKDR